MKEAFFRIRVPSDVLKRYKTLCIANDLSLPKQTTELIRHFVEIQEENLAKINASNRKGYV